FSVATRSVRFFQPSEILAITPGIVVFPAISWPSRCRCVGSISIGGTDAESKSRRTHVPCSRSALASPVKSPRHARQRSGTTLLPWSARLRGLALGATHAAAAEHACRLGDRRKLRAIAFSGDGLDTCSADAVP